MRVLVWDWPVRAFHWLLVLSFAGAWLASGDDRLTYLHVFFGYVAGMLVLFRLAWGFIGTRHALFCAFAASPLRALEYLRDLRGKTAPHYITHNPVGSWAVWLLLGLATALVLTGVLALGGEEQQGPLAGLLDRATGNSIGDFHELIAWAGLGLIAVHIAGVVVEGRLHGENLVRSMLDGRKDGAPGDEISSSRAAVALALCAGVLVFAGWYFRGYLTASEAQPYLPYTSAALPADPLWEEECGSCHLAYHPSLLPTRSWRRMFAQQQDHFGEELGLAPDTLQALQAFAKAHAAEKGESEAATKIAATTLLPLAPLRITETAYWRAKHADIPDTAWKTAKVHGRGDCAACHYDAEKATFEDAAMRIPR